MSALLPFEAPGLMGYSLTQDGIHTSLDFEPLMYMGSCIYEIESPVNLFHVSLILRPA